MVKVHHDANGNILGFYPDGVGYATIPAPFIEVDDATHAECIANPGRRRVNISTGQIVEYTLPGPVPAAAATIKRAAINAERNRREQLGFTYLGKTFDSDQTSVIRINAAVNTAVAAILANGTFSVTWTCADNTTIDLGAQQFLGLAGALAAHSDGLHQTARTLKTAVDAAMAAGATAAEIEALPTWTE
ncbi:MAG: DUF4376 domain-containing protein [Sporomusaceae bacterium]|nr:DUF4376 domain-containing protein [Sporomusaceae bacterium]